MIGDLNQFQIAAAAHAKMMKKLVTEARELRAFWDKLALPGGETATSPLVNADLTNYATYCETLQSLHDNVAIPAGDRRAVIERLATSPISMQAKIS